MRTALLTFISFLAIQSFCQDGRYLDREIQIEVDNDAFTLNIYLDQYYSQGSYGRYREVDTTNSFKRIKSIGLNHRIYTPRFISQTEVTNFDRPYAGQLSVTGSIATYQPWNFMEYSLEVGMMGKASLAEPIQKGWHKFFGMTQPEGWAYQINNAPILNGYFKYAHLLVKAGNLQILTESQAAIGTAFTYARSEVVIRIGKFKPLDESVFYASNLGHKQKKSKFTNETILFAAFGPEYVFYNSTIEGNLTGEASIHTDEIVPWVTQARAGAMFAWSSFDLSLLYYFRTVETKGARDHNWVGVKLSQRF